MLSKLIELVRLAGPERAAELLGLALEAESREPSFVTQERFDEYKAEIERTKVTSPMAPETTSPEGA